MAHIWYHTNKCLTKKQLEYLALFIIGIAVFGYMIYVLIKPEKF